jgi:hypothetical protein
VRGFLLGLVLLTGLSLTVLAIRPGGFRRQLQLAGRRLRLVLALGGIYIVGSTLIRLFFPYGWVAEFGPIVIAIVLVGAFVVLAQDPAPPPAAKP